MIFDPLFGYFYKRVIMGKPAAEVALAWNITTTSVNAVKSQETTSKNNLNTAVSNAQTTIQNMIDNTPRVVIMTVAEYEALSSINTNFVYILKPNPTE